MSSTLARLNDLKRPKLLVRAARLAADNLQRKPVLRCLFSDEEIPANPMTDLTQMEFELNAKRKSGDADYSIARHVTVLAALMQEAAIALT